MQVEQALNKFSLKNCVVRLLSLKMALADGFRIAELEAENRRLLQELDERTRATERIEDEKTTLQQAVQALGEKHGQLQQIVTETAASEALNPL